MNCADPYEKDKNGDNVKGADGSPVLKTNKIDF